MIDFGYGVALGRIDPYDLATLRSWRNHPQIRKWCRQNDLISAEAQEEWYQRQEADPTIQMYTIRLEVEDRLPILLGVCGLTSIDLLNRRAEFSLYIRPDYHRMGYARRALKTLVHHGFVNYGLRCIWGESFEGNPAMSLFISLGFQEEGVRRDFYYRDGNFINAHLFSLVRPDWDRLVSSWKIES